MGSHQKDFCATCIVSIFCGSVCVVGWRVIEMLSGAKLNFLSCHPPPLSLPPFLPLFFFTSLSFPPPHVRNARSRLEFSFQPVFPLPLPVCLSPRWLSLRLSVFFTLFLSPPLHVQTCSLLYVRAHFELWANSSQPMYVSGESYVHLKGRALGGNAMLEVKSVSMWEQTVPNCC